VKITVIGVEVLKVNEQAIVMDEMRPRVPGRDVQLDQAIAGHSKGGDILDTRPRIIIKVARWRDADQPLFAAERAQALRDPPVARDPAEAESDMRQKHDPQPRLAIAQDELCLTGRGLGVVAGLGTLGPFLQAAVLLGSWYGWRFCHKRERVRILVP
jgi:hypothetical protein